MPLACSQNGGFHLEIPKEERFEAGASGKYWTHVMDHATREKFSPTRPRPSPSPRCHCRLMQDWEGKAEVEAEAKVRPFGVLPVRGVLFQIGCRSGRVRFGKPARMGRKSELVAMFFYPLLVSVCCTFWFLLRTLDEAMPGFRR